MVAFGKVFFQPPREGSPMILRVERTGARGAAALAEEIRRRGCASVFSWADPPGRSYAPHQHPHDEVIGVVRGAIEFQVDGRSHLLEPGDLLHLPAGTVHGAKVLLEGVEFLIGSP